MARNNRTRISNFKKILSKGENPPQALIKFKIVTKEELDARRSKAYKQIM